MTAMQLKHTDHAILDARINALTERLRHGLIYISDNGLAAFMYWLSENESSINSLAHDAELRYNQMLWMLE